MGVRHWAVGTLVMGALLVGPAWAQSQPRAFTGVLDLKLSTGASPESRQGPCAIDPSAVQQAIVARLRRDGIRGTSMDELLQMQRRHMREDALAREAVARDPRLADRLENERRRRIRIEEELGGQLTLATGLNSMPVLSMDGAPGCVVTIHIRVTGSTPETRLRLSATGRQVAAPIFLWDSSMHLSFVPAAAWTPSVERPTVEVLESFLRVYRDDNRVGGPAPSPGR